MIKIQTVDLAAKRAGAADKKSVTEIKPPRNTVHFGDIITNLLYHIIYKIQRKSFIKLVKENTYLDISIVFIEFTK